MLTEVAITSFRGTVFSNFTPCRVFLDNVVYPSVEHAYQAAKTLDLAQRAHIRELPTAGAAKAAGRRVTMRADWDAVKIDVMRSLLRQKFALGSTFALQLLHTGTCELVEVNTWGDRFWGECPRGSGANHLGKLLMQRRAELQAC